MSRLLPELICSDLRTSLAFYELLGFVIEYERPLERFVYLPYGRGVNPTLDVDDVEALCTAVTAAGHRLYLPLEERWYGRTDDAVGVHQFAVQDPDGYLLRVSQHKGTKALL